MPSALKHAENSATVRKSTFSKNWMDTTRFRKISVDVLFFCLLSGMDVSGRNCVGLRHKSRENQMFVVYPPIFQKSVFFWAFAAFSVRLHALDKQCRFAASHISEPGTKLYKVSEGDLPGTFFLMGSFAQNCGCTVLKAFYTNPDAGCNSSRLRTLLPKAWRLSCRQVCPLAFKISATLAT